MFHWGYRSSFDKTWINQDGPELPYHAVSEFCFDDNDARLAAFATPEGKAAAEDAASHYASRVHQLTEEK